MIRKNQRLINGLNLLSDQVLIFFSYFAALFTKFFLIERHNGTLVWFSESLYWGVALAYSALLVVVYYFAGLYGSYRFKKQRVRSLLFWLSTASACWRSWHCCIWCV